MNPFKKISGFRALLVGMAFVTATAVTGYLCGTVFAGSFQVRFITGITLPAALLCHFGSIAVLISIGYTVALILDKKIRFTGLVGAMALSRYPYLLAVTPGFFIHSRETAADGSIFEAAFDIGRISMIILAGIIMMAAALFATYLLFRGYRYTTGLKGSRLVFSFAVILVASEVVCRVLGMAVI